MLLFPLNEDGYYLNIQPSAGNNDTLVVKYQIEKGGQLSLITVFLPNNWMDAKVNIIKMPASLILRIPLKDNKIEIPLESFSNYAQD